MIAWIQKNAAWLQSVLQAGLALGVGFDLPVKPQQIALILAFSAVVLGVGAHVANQSQSSGS